MYRMGVDAKDRWVPFSWNGYEVKEVSGGVVLERREIFCVGLLRRRGELFQVNIKFEGC